MKSSSNLPSDDVLGRPRDVLLRWTGRINRVRFFGAMMLACLVVSVPLVVFIGLAHLLGFSVDDNAFLTFSIVCSVMAQSSSLFQRAHDVGVSGAVMMASLGVPLAYALLLGMPPRTESENSSAILVSDSIAIALQVPFWLLMWWPGQKGENRYGPAPMPV